MARRFEGKVVLITGIAAGMGREAARKFAAEGAVVVGCDLDPEGLAATAALVESEGGVIDGTAPLDAADADAVAGWIDAAAARHGRIDVLYNNAGWQAPFKPIDSLPVADWDRNVQLELSLVFYAARAAWKHLAETKGVIINIGSVAGVRGVSFIPQNVHGSAKAGVINLTQHLAVEGGPLGIRAVSISPGFIVTEATKFLVDSPPPALKETWDRIPLGRVGEPADVVNAALFLASEDASWITGVNLMVDGGGTTLD